jgi:hypothetical protein
MFIPIPEYCSGNVHAYTGILFRSPEFGTLTGDKTTSMNLETFTEQRFAEGIVPLHALFSHFSTITFKKIVTGIKVPHFFPVSKYKLPTATVSIN